MMKRKTIYLAGGLFNAGERLHLLYLEKQLKALGWEIILPQREALNFFKKKEGLFDIDKIVADCRKKCSDPKIVYVGCLDGADPDSGTGVEFGIAITTNGKAVTYRTDFRTSIKNEAGVNAMFRIKESKYIYEPCFFTELDQIDQYYRKLAKKIDNKIKNM